jgi:hypothetical protein
MDGRPAVYQFSGCWRSSGAQHVGDTLRPFPVAPKGPDRRFHDLASPQTLRNLAKNAIDDPASLGDTEAPFPKRQYKILPR